MWNVIGQDRAVSFLEHSLERGTHAHAYLLVGPPHVGKMTLALQLAQALNCEGPEPPCLECDSCRKIAASGHADVTIIGLARNEEDEAKLIGIDQIKEIQHSASLPPFEGRNKVFIIDNAELMSTEAANCLLKTLEEPTGKVVFLLLTSNDALLLPTVVSRCQRLELAPMPLEEETRVLVEKLGLDTNRARLLAGLSHGCPGWAMAAAGDEELLRKRDEGLDRLLGFLGADIEDRFDFVGQVAGRFSQNRAAVYEMLDLWLDFWRDLMLVKLGCHDIIINVDRRETLVGLAGEYRLESIRGFITSLRSAAENLKRNVNPRLALEVLMLDIPVKEGGNGEVPASRSPV